MYKETTKDLLSFIENSPSCFHAIDEAARRLREKGFKELKEKDRWELSEGGYYVTRNSSSIIAFYIPKDPELSVRITAAHSDSPTFKIKENPEISVESKYIKLNTEKYGGMICSPWLDRPLSVAGRIFVKADNEGGEHSGAAIKEIKVNVDRDLLIIPNVAIHMNRNVNDGYKFDPQTDMLPLFAAGGEKGRFMKLIAESAGVKEEDILSHDLYLYNRCKGSIWGADEEFVSSPKLDDLQCAYSTLTGFLEGDKKKHISICCMFDNEEVGSATRQGAGSTFLYDVLMRICSGIKADYEDHLRMLSEGIMLSADNAHAVHPNHAEYTDPTNRPYINEGIVIKFNAQQKYCTDGYSAAFFKELCMRAGVPFQVFVNRSDMLGGSTLGNISNTKVALKSVDIGLPQLAMHSPYETAGVKDTDYMVKAVKEFFE